MQPFKTYKKAAQITFIIGLICTFVAFLFVMIYSLQNCHSIYTADCPNPSLASFLSFVIFANVLMMFICLPLSLILTIVAAVKKSNHKINMEAKQLNQMQSQTVSQPTLVNQPTPVIQPEAATTEVVDNNNQSSTGSALVVVLVWINFIFFAPTIFNLPDLLGISRDNDYWVPARLCSFILIALLFVACNKFLQYNSKADAGLVKGKLSSSKLAPLLIALPFAYSIIIILIHFVIIPLLH